MEFVYGAIGFLFSLVVFVLGFHLGRKAAAPVKRKEEKILSEAEQDRIERERRELEEDQRAFRRLAGYSADIAYGLVRFPSESED